MIGFGFFADEGNKSGDARENPAPVAASPSPKPDKPVKKAEEPKEVVEGEAEGDQQVLASASVGGEVGDALQTILPWLTSLLVHLGIVLMAMFATWVIIPAIEEDSAPIIPVARLSDNPGGGSLTATSETASLQATQQFQRNVESKSVGSDSNSNLESINDNLGTSEDIELIGVAGAAGESGKTAPFGTTTGTSTESQFYGIGVGSGDGGGNAREIIYLVDASGSLISGLPFVLRELKNSINELSEKQKFTVIFFQDGAPMEVPPIDMKPATRENKNKCFDWISPEKRNIIPRGKTDPVAAIKLALRYKPQLIFILSDNITGSGEYEVDRADLIKLVADSNKPDAKGELRTKINTIQFLTPDPLATLEELAKKNGGISKFITEKDLGLESK